MRKIEQTVMSTMIGPLWARAFYGEKNPEILVDKYAKKVYAQVIKNHPNQEYEFSLIDKFMNEMGGLGFIIRARTYDDLILNYIKDHPGATIVNLGCGLDSTFSRIDNGILRFFELDLPEAIEYRKKFIAETPRDKCVAKSIFDYSWFDDIDFNVEKGIFLYAAGLMNYFKEVQIFPFFEKIAAHFPGGQFAFDNPSTLGNKIMNIKMHRLGISGSDFYFAVDDPFNQFSKISKIIHVIDHFTLYSRIAKNPQWKFQTKLQMWFAEHLKLFKVIHLEFQKS